MNHCLKNWISLSHPPLLSGTACHVWKIDLSKSQHSDSSLLSTQEIKRSTQFRQDKDRDNFVIVRSTLRALAAAYMGSSAETIKIAYGSHNKPFIDNDTNLTQALQFNISHAGDLALLAFCRDIEIGIDIEHIKRHADFYKLAQRFFSREEFTVIAETPEDQLACQFFRLWTRKEAFVKAVGTGLGFPFNKFSISPDINKQPRLVSVDQSRYAGPCSLFDIEIQQDYMASVASLSPALDFSLFLWPLESA